MMPNGIPSRRAGFTSHQLARARQLEREFLDRLGKILQRKILIGVPDRMMDHARTRNTDIDHGFSFTNTVKSAGHERIVFDGIREADKLRARESASIASSLSSVFDDSPDLGHHVHVDAGARRWPR